MGVIPTKFVLEPGLKRKDILRKDYNNMTVADLREFIAELPDDATVWVDRYDEVTDEIYTRPLESMSSSSAGRHSYLCL